MTPINLLDALATVRRQAVRIALWALGLALAGYLIALVIPSTYRAVAVILPPDDDELTAALSPARRGMGVLGGLGRMGTYFTQADIALAILRSRSVYASIADQFDLGKVYGTKGEERTIRRLKASTEVKLGPDGTITVAVMDHDARRAADLANGLLKELDRYNNEFRTFRARRTRQFLERRVAESDSTLHSLEQRLAAYQKVHGAVVLPPDARGGADAASRLMAEKLSADVELELARTYASAGSEEVERLEARSRELGRQIGNLPRDQVGGAAMLRAIAVQEQVFAMLTAQLEDARVREAMDTPTIQVLDRATPPEIRAWPRRAWIAAFGGVLGLALGIAEATGLLRRSLRPA